MYNKKIIRFGFCDIQNNQPQPSASADNSHLDLDYSGYHRNLAQWLFIIVQKTYKTSTNIPRYYSFGYLYCRKPVLQAGFQIARHAKIVTLSRKQNFISINYLFTKLDNNS